MLLYHGVSVSSCNSGIACSVLAGLTFLLGKLWGLMLNKSQSLWWFQYKSSGQKWFLKTPCWGFLMWLPEKRPCSANISNSSVSFRSAPQMWRPKATSSQGKKKPWKYKIVLSVCLESIFCSDEIRRQLNSLSKAIPLVPQWWHLFATLDQESDEHFYHHYNFLRHSNLKFPSMLSLLNIMFTDILLLGFESCTSERCKRSIITW